MPSRLATGFSAIIMCHIPSGQDPIIRANTTEDSRKDLPMNVPGRVIGFVNAAHFIDHYSMLIFAAAVIVMGPALGMAYSDLLPYATPGFIAFGAGSLLTGWLGDRWSRRHMIVIFFFGIGLSMITRGLGQTPLPLRTGVVGQYLGWRWAFIVPGIVTILIGVAFAMTVVHEDRTGSKQAAAQA